MKDGVFGAPLEIAVTGQGNHTLELRNINGPAYADKICVTNGASANTPVTSALAPAGQVTIGS